MPAASRQDSTATKPDSAIQDPFRLLAEAVKDYAIIALDPQGRITGWNAGAALLYGYEEPEIVGQPLERLYAAETVRAGTLARLLALVVANGRAADEAWQTRKDGTSFLADIVLTALRDRDGNMIGIGEIARDITDRKNREDRLNAIAEQLRRAEHLAHMGSDIRILQTGERIWSDECYKIFGVSRETFSPSNESLLPFFHPDDRDRILVQREEVRAGICPEPMEYRIFRPDGSLRHIYREWEFIYDADGVPLHLLGTLHDVTEKRHTEEELRQMQKMEAIGSLTGGMAHDFNNLLGVVIGNLDLAGMMKIENADLKELVDESLNAALRGADLTQRLLAFARRQPLRPKQIDVNAMVSSIAELLGRTLGTHIEIVLDLAEEAWPITADPKQLEAGLTNLITNARDAMPRGGRLIITTANGTLDADYVETHQEATPGEFTMIAVTDTGMGIPPEAIEHIFEPFFTTKGPGQGTGLGLSMVFGFTKQSGGHVAVYSEPGIGTTVRLFLPRTLTAQAVEQVADHGPAPKGAGEIILVVEDNPAMRRIVTRQLQDLGYHVLEADRAAAAVEILERDPVDLLLTDFVIPGTLDGVELAGIVQQRWPAVKILLTSGFPRTRFDELHNVRLLTKPYRQRDLAAKLHAMLST